MDRTHAERPEQSPDQPTKRDRAPGRSESDTLVPFTKVATHVPPQLMPAGELVTVPVPAPALVTVSVREGGGGGGGGGATALSVKLRVALPPLGTGIVETEARLKPGALAVSVG